MKKLILTTLFATSITVSGCASNDEAERDLNRTLDGDDNDVNRFDTETESNRNDDELSSQLGYVHYKEEDLDQDVEEHFYVSVDRKKMADTITRLILRYDGFNDAATLVTDDEVLIAYDKPERLDREQAATIVKKTGLSVLPRYYHVYVSDRDVTFRDIQSLQNSSTLDDDYENTLNNIIEDMKQAPQGEKVDDEYDREHETNNM
ncbi:YhcN/YlaJ family sporulation lipoprotein [Aquibacillus kalidii]|uniref:YhcN/YlaJ family sporulation lipoprotein n=1 Tax=Aquibacillus kalidii TaxID=2762597 RepID=UPI0016471B4B|nr:YhcN/YlaJ family sporulation lipoprotein [Aquibacillus kalidii]